MNVNADDVLVLPCGCRMWTDTVFEVPTFVVEPHALDCSYYEYILEQAEELEKPVSVIDLRRDKQ
jgi:hypothetical protein